MVVRLRLQRFGVKHWPVYRIVAADARAKRDGRFLEVLGRYCPTAITREERAKKMKRVELDVQRIKYWISVGAQPSDTVARLLSAAGVIPERPQVGRSSAAE